MGNERSKLTLNEADNGQSVDSRPSQDQQQQDSPTEAVAMTSPHGPATKDKDDPPQINRKVAEADTPVNGTGNVDDVDGGHGGQALVEEVRGAAAAAVNGYRRGGAAVFVVGSSDEDRDSLEGSLLVFL